MTVKKKNLSNVSDKLSQFVLFISLGLISNMYAYPRSKEFMISITNSNIGNKSQDINVILGGFGICSLFLLLLIYLEKINDTKSLVAKIPLFCLILGILYSDNNQIFETILSNITLSIGIAYILYILTEIIKNIYKEILESHKTDPIKKYGILIPIITFIIGLLVK